MLWADGDGTRARKRRQRRLRLAITGGPSEQAHTASEVSVRFGPNCGDPRPCSRPSPSYYRCSRIFRPVSAFNIRHDGAFPGRESNWISHAHRTGTRTNLRSRRLQTGRSRGVERRRVDGDLGPALVPEHHPFDRNRRERSVRPRFFTRPSNAPEARSSLKPTPRGSDAGFNLTIQNCR